MKDDSSVSSSKVGAHTPEPWKVRKVGTTEYPSGEFHTVCEIRGTDGAGLADHVLLMDASRIVACVNACAGVSTAALEDGCQPALAGTRMQRQRDELAEALRVAAERLKARGHNMGASEALAVLAKLDTDSTTGTAK